MNEKNNATPTVSKTSPKSALLSVCTLFRKYSVSPCITQLFKLRGIFRDSVIDLQFTANSARRFIPLFLLLALSLLSGCKAAQTEPAPPSPSFYESSSFIAPVSPSLPMPQSPDTPSPSPSLCLHRPALLPALAPTCTKEGLSEGLYCPLCGLTLRAQSVLSPTGHRYEQSRCTLCGDYEESKGLTFALRDGYCAVTGIGSFVGKTLVIPQIHEGLPVKEIAEGAFYNAYGNDERLELIKTLVLQEGITAIGKDAFGYLTNLEELSLPEGLKTIGERAFGGCFSLKSLSLPESLEEIGKSAFVNCSSLPYVLLKTTPSRIDAFAFYGVKALFLSVEARPEGWHVSFTDTLCTVYFKKDWQEINGVPTPKN